MKKVLTMSTRMDWRTPQHIIDSVHGLFGRDFLDPCTDATNPTGASRFYAEGVDDGLALPWDCDAVYMNPPYGRTLPKWINKLADERRKFQFDAIVLTPARVDTKWWRELTGDRDVMACMVHGRLRFQGAPSGAPFPTSICYIGSRRTGFMDQFSKHGTVWYRR